MLQDLIPVLNYQRKEGERSERWNTSAVNSLSAEAAANSAEVPRITPGRAVCQRAWQLQHVCLS